MNTKNLAELAPAEVKDKPLPQWETGECKWYDQKRRYGFIFFDDETDGHDEAFLTWLCVQESNIRESSLRPGTKVRFTWKPSKTPGGRPEVTRLALVDRRR